MRSPVWLVAVALAVATSGCPGTPGPSSPPPAAPEPSPEEVTRARAKAEAAADKLVSELSTKLSEAVGTQGAEGAIGFCSKVAQDLTRKLGEDQGVSIRRTALRLRNKANAPDAYEKAYLERTERDLAAGRGAQPSVEVQPVASGGRELRLLRPIVYKGGVCEQCHGAPGAIPAGVRAKLAERYPEDQATGFKAGDLRGALSVRVSLGRS